MMAGAVSSQAAMALAAADAVALARRASESRGQREIRP